MKQPHDQVDLPVPGLRRQPRRVSGERIEEGGIILPNMDAEMAHIADTGATIDRL
jgi:hypothetical protein